MSASHRQSVDRYASLSASQGVVSSLPSMVEEGEVPHLPPKSACTALSAQQGAVSSGESKEEERAARGKKSRQRVLQAVDLIVTADSQTPQRKRRPAPQRFTSGILSKDLPPVPDQADAGFGADDAFDRYQTFRLLHGNVSCMSVASVVGGRSPPGESRRRSMPTISAPIPVVASHAESSAFGTVSAYSVFLLGQLIGL
jgi:hypothetical protein